MYIFDMGGVVTTDAAAVERQMERVLGLAPGGFLECCGRPEGVGSDGADLLAMCSDGTISSKEFWRMFSERSGRTVTTDWWHWLFHPVRNENTCAIIRALRKQGHRVVCGTNTIDSHYFNHLERGDYALFDQTYASCFMGVSKPDLAFWKLILTAERVEPSECVFIDDKKINCDAASSLGIYSIEFTTAEHLAHTLGVQL